MSKSLKTLENVIAFLATTSGRDKVSLRSIISSISLPQSCRFVQYFGKFAKAFFLYMAIKYKNPILKELSDKSDFLGTSMGMTRKVILSI